MIILDEIACYFASARASFTTTHNSGVYYLKRQGNLEFLKLKIKMNEETFQTEQCPLFY